MCSSFLAQKNRDSFRCFHTFYYHDITNVGPFCTFLIFRT
nr:MAG TPA: hypothetical protein [Caudoviricetes sp.]